MIHDRDHERLFDSLPAYVLGALTDEERVEIEDAVERQLDGILLGRIAHGKGIMV